MDIDELLAVEEIKNLRLAYSAYFDTHDIEALGTIFAEDAVCEFDEAFGGDWVGREAICANYAAVAEQLGAPVQRDACRDRPLDRARGSRHGARALVPVGHPHAAGNPDVAGRAREPAPVRRGCTKTSTARSTGGG